MPFSVAVISNGFQHIRLACIPCFFFFFPPSSPHLIQTTASVIDSLMKAHGGTCLLDLTKGDAAGLIQAEFEDWTKTLWPILLELLDMGTIKRAFITTTPNLFIS